jgi:glucose/arabinose dehydrogenase
VRADVFLCAASVALCGCVRADCSADAPDVGDATSPLSPAGGFSAHVVLEGLLAPTQLQFDASGRLFVLEGGPQTPKSVRIFSPSLAAAGGFTLDTPGESTGLLVLGRGERLLVASRTRVDAVAEAPGGGYLAPVPWVVDLPDNPEHTNNGLALGPDGFAYFGVGSSCDVCDETDARSGTVMRAAVAEANPSPEVFARGLRNVYDVAFDESGRLLAADNGPECCGGPSECRGPVPDRLVELAPGADLGWPGAYLGRSTLPEPLARLAVHGGVTGLTVARAPGCPDAVYLTLFGSERGPTEAGRRVQRVELSTGGGGALAARAPEDVLGPAGLLHPIDAAQGPDGALYVLDYGGRVVRLTQDGPCP